MKMNRQFGRYVEVEIRDFDNKVKTIIGNEFEIEFDYFKTLDQTQEDDSGSIRIFGLTPERTKSLQVEGGEVRLRCGYIAGEVHTLFVASIARLYANTTENTTVTTIECSANLMNYYYTGGTSTGVGVGGTMDVYSFLKSEVEEGETMGGKGNTFGFSLANVPENRKTAVKEFLTTSAVKITAVGSRLEVFSLVCDALGLAVNTTETGDGTRQVLFSIKDAALVSMFRDIDEGYEKVRFAPETLADDSLFFGTLKTEEDESEVIVLSNLSGLIEAKIEYKIATAYADQVEYSGTDVETLKSKQKRADAKNKAAIKNKKEAEKVIKAAKKGNEYKAKFATESTVVQVTRQYNRVKALLNPLIRPQSMVLVFESADILEEDKTVGGGTREASLPIGSDPVDGSYGKYRVRNATYKGNNKRDDWIMDLYCESTDGVPATEENIKKFLATVSSEDVEFTDVGSAEEGADYP